MKEMYDNLTDINKLRHSSGALFKYISDNTIINQKENLLNASKIDLIKKYKEIIKKDLEILESL